MIDFLDDIDGFLNAEEDVADELRQENRRRYSSFVADDDRYEDPLTYEYEKDIFLDEYEDGF